MKFLLIVFLLISFHLFAQKKPLDHTVYDGWQSIGERIISNDGKWVVYTVTPQEGDADLYIQSTENIANKKQVPRGYNAVITEDSRYAVFRIKPYFKETRDARIKKKKIEDLPKDSIAIVELGKDAVLKVAKVRSYKTPEKGFGWVAYHKEREALPARTSALPTQKTVDSLRTKIDSLTQLVVQLKNIKGGNRDEGSDADDDPAAGAATVDGTDLVVRNLLTGKERTLKNVADYYFDKQGTKLVIKLTKPARDSNSKNAVALYNLKTDILDTILKGGNDFRGFAFADDGSKLAFVAERDTATKALQKFYGLYLYRAGFDSAQLLLDKASAGMWLGMTISENGAISFSKSGKRLLFGTALITPPKDTSLVDFETAKLDIWNYKDDYLQSQQLFNLQTELKRSYLASYDFGTNKFIQLGTPGLPTIIQTDEGDGKTFVAITDTGRRVQSQWTGTTLKDVYAIDATTGQKKLVKKNHDGAVYPSSTGRYILLYDNKAKNYFAWDGTALKNITSKIKVPLYNEEYDQPDDPNPYGIMGWHEGDSAVYVYDRYDVWKVDVQAKENPVNLTNQGRKEKTSFRYVRWNNDERFFRFGQPLFFRRFDERTKDAFLEEVLLKSTLPSASAGGNQNRHHSVGGLVKSKNSNAYLLTWESAVEPPDLFLTRHNGPTDRPIQDTSVYFFSEQRLTEIYRQQMPYKWLTAELYKWKTFDGKSSTGILYKPEDFDPKKKYPMITYFYEKLSDGLYTYNAPSPTPSRLNIPFFVSRGYLVFAPDISYTKGHPGKDAYNYIVSGVQSLLKNPWVDGKNLGLQGQSWGGYQVAYLVTATNMFKAAWAGAPVVNMFSAYGGIRWESGANRQFQYEKGQSRIGATPWERPDLYIENSPLFHLQKIKTPLVIMSNDADGAVPWYQGIEFFTAMRRLNKPIWLLSYNGEAHNLVERRNRKDIQIREQQYFDWLLKGAQPPKWITEGIPAVKKGRDWGLGF